MAFIFILLIFIASHVFGGGCVQHVQPEILVIVDDSLHNILGRDISTTKEYVRNFWSGVNLRFRSLTSPSVELVVAGLEIGSTPYLRQNSRGLVEANGALDKMGKHFYNRNNSGHDLIVTMTGLDLCRKIGSRCSSNTVGYAYVGGACVINSRQRKVSSVALVQDNGGFGGVLVAAHEVAHLLGVPHDGDPAPSYVGGPGSRSCKWNDGFIMSDRRKGIKGLAWSSCTQKQMRHFIDSPTASCLKTRASASMITLLPTSSALSTKVISPDEQCQREAGLGSRSCFTDKRICTQLFCLQPKTGHCIAYRPAMEGSLCGSKGYCSGGLCLQQQIVQNQITQSTNTKKPNLKTNNNAVVTTNDIISEQCQDDSRINFRGITNCNRLFKSFAFLACKNRYVQKRCCASHAAFC